MKTIALVIGISDYKDSAFHPLPGAKADAARFTSALALWGLPSEWIFQIDSENATKAEIIKTFYQIRSEFDVEAKFILYFAGHGERNYVANSTHIESSLILQDTNSQDILGTGLRLVELMQLIRSLKPQQTFLFFDACRLRLNHLDNPLNDIGIFSSTNSKGLFCLFSSGVQPSYEDNELKSGYFTTALLKAINELRYTNQPSCHEILKKVENRLLSQGLPTPEAYHIGSSQIWPLARQYTLDKVHTDQGGSALVERWEALNMLQEQLATSTASIIWMWGEAGRGKTVIAEQLKKRVPNSIYASISNLQPLELIFQSLIEQIRTQKSELFFNRPPESLLYIALNHIKDFQPDTLLILDHIDRLPSHNIQEVVSHIDRVELPCLLVCRRACPKHFFKMRNKHIFEWQASAFNADETEELIEKCGLQNSLSEVLRNVSNGNALKMRQMLIKLSGQKTPLDGKMSPESIKCIKAIISCGGFLDESLFCKNYNIKPSSLSTLEQYGLIRFSKEGCFAHDLLEELVEENQWSLDFDKAGMYWNTQIQHTPFNRFACRSLVILSGYIKDCQPFKAAFEKCLDTLNEREYRSFLLDLTSIFKKYDWTDLLLKASDYLVDHEEYKQAGIILEDLIQALDPTTRHHAAKNAIRRLVWIGRYKEAINLYAEVSETCQSEELLVAMRNHVGVAYFFLGNFEIAVDLFMKNIESGKLEDKRELGITQYMLALIMTYRNENLSVAKNLFEESILIFESTKYYHWTIVGLNGLAVLHNSMREHHQALRYLQKSLEIAEALQNKTFLLQTLKNIARVQLRLFNPKSAELSTTLEALERILKEVLKVGSNWATMWVQNILCTVYAHRHEPEKMQPLIEEVYQLTQHYDECHIFSLSNMGHFAALNHNYEHAKQYYSQAYQLCKKARIPLIQKEIREDFLNCNLPAHLQIDEVFS